jgi:hypothetical protein
VKAARIPTGCFLLKKKWLYAKKKYFDNYKEHLFFKTTVSEQFLCGVAQLVVRGLAVRQARVWFSAHHPREVFYAWWNECM